MEVLKIRLLFYYWKFGVKNNLYRYVRIGSNKNTSVKENFLNILNKLKIPYKKTVEYIGNSYRERFSFKYKEIFGEKEVEDIILSLSQQEQTIFINELLYVNIIIKNNRMVFGERTKYKMLFLCNLLNKIGYNFKVDRKISYTDIKKDIVRYYLYCPFFGYLNKLNNIEFNI